MSETVDVVIEFEPYPGSGSAGGPWAPPPIDILAGVTTQLGAYAALGFTQANALGLTVGNPTGGYMGLGTVNATGLFVNGVAVAALVVPTASLLSGDGTALHGITIGTGLTLTGSTLSSTGGVTIPNATIVGGNGSALTSIAVDGTTLTVSTGTLALAPISATKLYGNPTGSSAVPVPITLGTGLSFSGNTLNSSSLSVPTASLLSGNGSALGAATAGSLASLATTAGITDTSTAGISTTGAFIFGANSTGGAPGSNGGILANFSTYNYAATSGNPVRQRDITDTITVTGTMTGVDEGFTVSRAYLGSGNVNAETNGFHVFGQSAAGLTMGQWENIETSTLFSGTHGTADSLLLLQHYTTTGTVTTLAAAVNIGLTNDNTTAGSIAEYCGIFMGAMGGAGSLPTNYFFGLNGDANAAFETLGKMQVGGSLTASSGIAAQLTVIGPDVSAGTLLLRLSSSGVTNVFTVSDSGVFTATGNMSWTGAFVVTSTLTLGVAGTTAGTANFNTTTAAEAVSLKAPSATTGGVVTVTLPNAATTIAGLSIAQTFLALQTFNGHIAGGRTIAPTIASGGTLDAQSSDMAGTATTGTASTGFTITFGTAYATAPHVVISSPSGNAFTSYTVSTTAITLVCAALTGATFTYQVVQ